MRSPRTTGRPVLAIAMTLTLGAGLVPAVARGADAPTFPSDTAKPNLIPLLTGYDRFWQSDGKNDLHGTVLDGPTLARNDRLTVFINSNATAKQRFRALQDSSYDNAAGTAYDQSLTISDGLGSVLGPLYVKGRRNGSLPLTSALINSQTGLTGAYVSTGDAKARFSYPRPYLPTDPSAKPIAGDEDACAPSKVNASSLAANRRQRDYSDSTGKLNVQRVPKVTDTTREFSRFDVPLDAAYGTKSICTGGSFPSGHTTTAYQAGITLATLVPELAPEVLARASEAGNNRIVLGVHYPLDIVGGRISGQAALSARWSDPVFRSTVLEPARRELVGYLERRCRGTIERCAARGTSYRDDPYGGKSLPGGTDQVVTDRRSALRVYRERLTYGFRATGTVGQPPSVPTGAENLLLTAYPGLTDGQRASVLAQTELASGYPLDGTGTAAGGWQRLNLAAALSATVRVKRNGAVKVTETGGQPRVVYRRR